jgi:nucleoid-associated protein YgaU
VQVGVKIQGERIVAVSGSGNGRGMVFTTTADGQTRALFRIYGKKTPRDSWRFVRDFLVKGIPPSPAGTPELILSVHRTGSNGLTLKISESTSSRTSASIAIPETLGPSANSMESRAPSGGSDVAAGGSAVVPRAGRAAEPVQVWSSSDQLSENDENSSGGGKKVLLTAVLFFCAAAIVVVLLAGTGRMFQTSGLETDHSETGSEAFSGTSEEAAGDTSAEEPVGDTADEVAAESEAGDSVGDTADEVAVESEAGNIAEDTTGETGGYETSGQSTSHEENTYVTEQQSSRQETEKRDILSNEQNTDGSLQEYGSQEASPGENEYIITYGDTMWDISRKFYGDPMLYPSIAEINGIFNPDLIISGDSLVIPEKPEE